VGCAGLIFIESFIVSRQSLSSVDFIKSRQENREVFSFVDESPDLLLPTMKRADPLIQKTLLAQVVRIQAL